MKISLIALVSINLLLSIDTKSVGAAVFSSSSIADRHVKPFLSASLFPEANFHIDTDASIANVADGLGELLGYEGRAYGSASVHPHFLHKIQQLADTAVGSVATKIQMLRITKSSPRHIDCKMDGLDMIDMLNDKSNDGQVGFFVRNTNPSAYFETDDGERCIPIVEGTLIHFDGSLPHRTIIKSGHVDLIGPFLPSTFDETHLLLGMLLQAGSGVYYGCGLSGLARARGLTIGLAESYDYDVLMTGTAKSGVGRQLGTEDLLQFEVAINTKSLPSCDNCTFAITDSPDCDQTNIEQSRSLTGSDILEYTSSSDTWQKQIIKLENADSVSVVFYDGNGEIEACGVIEELTGEAEEWAESIFAEAGTDSDSEEEEDDAADSDEGAEGDSDNATTASDTSGKDKLLSAVSISVSVIFSAILMYA